MDKLMLITTMVEESEVDKTSSMLKNRGIPVTVQTINILDEYKKTSGYRLLVPSQFTEEAMNLVAQN